MQNSLVFRDFENNDYSQVIDFYNNLYPDDPTELDQLQSFDQKRNVKRVLVFENENLKAYYQHRPNDNSKENGFVLKIACESTTSSDLLSNIYRQLQSKLQTSELNHFITRVHEPETTLHNFFLSKGFLEEERMWPSTLFLESYSQTFLQCSLKAAKANGIQFKTLADFEDNETTQRMFYTCVTQCLLDVPTAESIDIWPFDLWRERYWNSNNHVAETNFLAFDGSKLVGISQLVPSPKIGNIRTGLTGVLSNYRKQGIAKALKQLATDYAIANGYETISTTNHSINKPMLGINEAMGYIKSPAIIFLKKIL